MTLSPPPLATSVLALLGAAAANVEYSIDGRPGAHGVTVPLRGDARAALALVASNAQLPGTWLRTVQRLLDAMLPDAILLRIDTDGVAIGALTAYLRFPREPGADALQALLGACSRLRVRPEALAALAQALSCPGARGIGIRGGADGSERLAVYFRVERDLQAFDAAALARLGVACGWRSEAGSEAGTDAWTGLAHDLRALHPGGSVGVIGVDVAADGAIAALKCDPANVRLDSAIAFLRRHGAGPDRIDACLSLCRALRARTLSYVGVKYDAAGCAGWRLYFSCRQHGAARNGQPAMLTDTPGSAALRMPHY